MQINLNIEKKSSWNMIFTLLYPNGFWHKRKNDNFDPHNVSLAIVANIPVTYYCFFAPGSHM